MKVLDAIPHELKGRGFSASIPIECASCGERFLFPAGRGNTVMCPSCKATGTIDEGAVAHDGQAV